MKIGKGIMFYGNEIKFFRGALNNGNILEQRFHFLDSSKSFYLVSSLLTELFECTAHRSFLEPILKCTRTLESFSKLD